MDRNSLCYLSALLLIATTGCSMCDNSLDNAFGAYGGRWQRTDPNSGRVASIFDPAGANVAGPQTAASREQEQVDDDRESVLKPEGVNRADGVNGNELLPDAMPTDLPLSEPVAGETERDADSAGEAPASAGKKSTELPDFFKELGLDSEPSPSAGSIEDLLPSGDSGNELPPLRIDAQQ